MNRYFLFFLSTCLIAFVSCKKNDDNKVIPVCNGSSPTYNSTVNAIISSRCNACHGSGSSNGDFSTYAKISSVTSNGKFENKVLNEQSMPTSGPLAESELNTLKCWVENGFPE